MPIEQTTVLLFSYGTLQLEAVQLANFGRRLEGRRDALPGYSLVQHEITDPEVIRTRGKRFHPVVAPSDDPADSVPGKVFSITAEELAAADRYEVADYKRISVRLASGKEAVVYVKA